MYESTAIRFMILMRTRVRVEVLGPRTVSKRNLNLIDASAAAHILRVRLVDLKDRWLLVSTQAAAYQGIGDPGEWLCPECYAFIENFHYASRRTHYPLLPHKLLYPVRCNECDEYITTSVH